MLLVPFLLSVLIIGFNYPDIFSLKTMYVDDNHRYILGLENKIHALIFQRNSLRALVLFPLYKLMSINLIYARLAQALIFYIPLAFSWYCLLRYYTNMPAWLIFCTSAVPCILPGQTQIPSFIDGSYTVQGLLVFVLMLHVSYLYLRTDYGFSWKYFVSAAVLYGASLEMMDHSVFLAPFAQFGPGGRRPRGCRGRVPDQSSSLRGTIPCSSGFSKIAYETGSWSSSGRWC